MSILMVNTVIIIHQSASKMIDYTVLLGFYAFPVWLFAFPVYGDAFTCV